MADTERNNKKINITELKNAFKEGAIPNEQDYGNLIDLAAVGGRVLGATEEDATALQLGDGLKYVDGKLAILPTPAGGVLVNKEGVSVKVDGNALAATEKGVALKLHQNGGLAVDDNGLHIKTGAGLKTDKDGVAVALVPKSGLTVEGNKLAVNLSQTSGLAFDDKGALKVHVNTEEKNNYITSTDKGLAITAEGVTKIKEALKEVSLTALESAVKGTDSGASSDYKPNGEVEAQISQALVNAYKQRSNSKIRETPTIVLIPQLKKTFDLKQELKKMKGIPEDTTFYGFIKGNDYKKLWGGIVKGLTPDGMLQLTDKDGGEINVLGVGISHDKEGPFPVMVKLMLRVAMPAVSEQSTIILDKHSYQTGEIMKCVVTLKDQDGNPVIGMKAWIKDYVDVPQHNNRMIDEWKEGENRGEYIGTFEAGAHGNHESAERHKASLQLPGGSEKRESGEFFIFAAPTVKDVKAESATVEAGKSLGVSYTFVSNGTGGDVSTYQWKYREGTSGDWKAPQSADAKKQDWIPDVSYRGYQVRLTITPTGKLHPEFQGAPVDGPEISIFVPVSLTGVRVNGHVFAPDAGFPTTGFKGAQFTLELDNAKASDYDWTSSSPSWVTVKNGVVTFTGMGDGMEVIITGITRIPKTTGQRHIEYKFKLKKWFTNTGDSTKGYHDAALLAFEGGHYASLDKDMVYEDNIYKSPYSASAKRRLHYLANEWGRLSNYLGAGWVEDPQDGVDITAPLYWVGIDKRHVGGYELQGLSLKCEADPGVAASQRVTLILDKGTSWQHRRRSFYVKEF
ncbi:MULTISPECIES: hypothetical protein [Serratia]|uniref:hypothetical protein n=1 Tax=Serratia TaxID=613 RepID=UPI0027E3B67B|nr:hypothetical protein [Serratia marcescens]MCS3414678.1 hypothetical protein [Serratia marcescens]